MLRVAINSPIQHCNSTTLTCPNSHFTLSLKHFVTLPHGASFHHKGFNTLSRLLSPTAKSNKNALNELDE